jgi:hypothetical protein
VGFGRRRAAKRLGAFLFGGEALHVDGVLVDGLDGSLGDGEVELPDPEWVGWQLRSVGALVHLPAGGDAEGVGVEAVIPRETAGDEFGAIDHLAHSQFSASGKVHLTRVMQSGSVRMRRQVRGDIASSLAFGDGCRDGADAETSTGWPASIDVAG